MSKFVKIQSKGMVTIPVKIRKKLHIASESLFEVKEVPNGVMFIKIAYPKAGSETELYSNAQIKQWLKDDQLDQKTVKKLKKIL